jgi:hypothetical protein
MNRRGLITGLVFIILLLVGGGIYLGAKNKDIEQQPETNTNTTTTIPSEPEATEWKSYGYSELGYSFKLPAKYTVHVENPGGPYSRSMLQLLTTSIGDMNSGPSDIIFSVDSGSSLEDGLKRITGSEAFGGTMGVLVTNQKQNRINGRVWTSFNLGVAQSEIQYATYANGRLYTVDGNKDNDELIRQVIATFDFSVNDYPASTDQDRNGNYIGSIKSISTAGARSSLVIDYVQWISPCSDSDSCPDNYKIVNDNPKLRTFPIAQDAQVLLATYSHNEDGGFKSGEGVSLATFINVFNNPTPMYPAKNLLYWITLRSGVVTSIEEQYQP